MALECYSFSPKERVYPVVDLSSKSSPTLLPPPALVVPRMLASFSFLSEESQILLFGELIKSTEP